jgi:transposase-like protein
LAAIRWPNGPVCDKCGSVNNAGKSHRPRYWHCHNCRQMFSVTAGTPMEETRLPLPKWFAAIFLIVTSSKGVSSMAVKRQIGVGYKTAWFLTHRIRAMLDTDDALLRGVVEVDETYIGGCPKGTPQGVKRRKGRKSKRDDEGDQPKGRAGTRKMMAVTAVERGGRAKARKGRTHSERTIARTIYDWADRNSTLVTDELPAYRWIGRKFRAHLRVNHSAGEWARLDPHGRGLIHTNTVESFNATIKRAIIGVWHWFSIKHGDRYLNELAARWNWRGMDNMARFDIALRGLFEPALPWKALTA